MLSQYPAIAERVREEVLSRLRGDKQPTPEDVKEMKYLRAFINEVLRLYPPVPYDSRCV
jgi:cytochrome P450